MTVGEMVSQMIISWAKIFPYAATCVQMGESINATSDEPPRVAAT